MPSTESIEAATATLTLPSRRAMLLDKIFVIWLWISAVMLASLLIAAVLLKFPYQLFMLAVSTAILVGCLVWARKSINQTYFTQSLLSLIGGLLIAAGQITFLFHNGLLSLLLAIIVSLLLLSLAGRAKAIPFATGFGVLITVLVALVEQFELAESWHLPENNITNFFMPFLIGIGLIIAGLFIYLLNDSLNQLLHEAEARGVVAETAQAEQALILAQVQQQSVEQARLLELVHDLETPVIPVLEGVLVLPVVGHLDTTRLNNLSHRLLERVAAERARTVLIDITAVSLIDTATANHLLQLTKGVRLLGAECILTGIRAEVAQTLVSLGVNWGTVPTAGSLRDALARLHNHTEHQHPI